MPTDWSDSIILSRLSDEPELSEELSAVFERLGQGAEGGRPLSLVLDFSGVTYLNSSHLAGLLRLRKRVADGKGCLILASMSDEVWSVMLLTGLDKIFTFSPDTMTALAGIQLEQERAESKSGS